MWPIRVWLMRSMIQASVVDFPLPALPVINHAPLPADSIFRHAIPATIKPNYYHAHFVFHDTLCYLNPEKIKDFETSTKLSVLYPDVIAQRWNDVLAIKNADYNGGYQFDSVQWYVNGAPIEGATDFIYYTGESTPLHMGSEYAALLTRKDGLKLFTCVYIPAPVAPEVTDLPSLVPLSAPLHIQGKGTAYWYDMLGRLHHSDAYDDSAITAPGTAGYYLLVLQSSASRSVHQMMVK